ncbi:MAG: hypothetical protein JSS58_08390 [Proteobacteria bacterium]|nr:hypothetical protein [Pseudomonadota bacterium]
MATSAKVLDVPLEVAVLVVVAPTVGPLDEIKVTVADPVAVDGAPADAAVMVLFPGDGSDGMPGDFVQYVDTVPFVQVVPPVGAPVSLDVVVLLLTLLTVLLGAELVSDVTTPLVVTTVCTVVVTVSSTDEVF